MSALCPLSLLELRSSSGRGGHHGNSHGAAEASLPSSPKASGAGRERVKPWVEYPGLYRRPETTREWLAYRFRFLWNLLPPNGRPDDRSFLWKLATLVLFQAVLWTAVFAALWLLILLSQGGGVGACSNALPQFC